MKHGAFCLLALLSSCAPLRGVLAPNDDLDAYRAYRFASGDGERLARAQRYLDGHPRGVWASEVSAALAEGEPAYFERAKESREAAIDYLAHLPTGPHAAAALAVVDVFDRRLHDLEAARLLVEARRTETLLERASAQRRAAVDELVALVAVLLHESSWGVSLDELPAELRRAIVGPARSTWGAPTSRDIELFFSVPAHSGRESRILSARFELVLEHGRVAEGRLRGPDLFVRWAEASLVETLDAADVADRAHARAHVRDLLEGALEATLPKARCVVDVTNALVERRCNGWYFGAWAGTHEGDTDTLVVRGP